MEKKIAILTIHGERQQGYNSNILDKLKKENLLNYPYNLFRPYFNGSDEEFRQFLFDKKLDETNNKFHSKDFLVNELGDYLQNFIKSSRSTQEKDKRYSSMFDLELSKLPLGSLNGKETSKNVSEEFRGKAKHAYEEISLDFSSLNDDDFSYIKDKVKDKLELPSFSSFLNIDEKNKLLIFTLSNRVLYKQKIDDKTKFILTYEDKDKKDDMSRTIRLNPSFDARNQNLQKTNINLTAVLQSIYNVFDDEYFNDYELVTVAGNNEKFTKSYWTINTPTVDLKLNESEKEALNVLNEKSSMSKKETSLNRGSLVKNSSVEKLENDNFNQVKSVTTNNNTVENLDKRLEEDYIDFDEVIVEEDDYLESSDLVDNDNIIEETHNNDSDLVDHSIDQKEVSEEDTKDSTKEVEVSEEDTKEDTKDSTKDSTKEVEVSEEDTKEIETIKTLISEDREQKREARRLQYQDLENKAYGSALKYLEEFKDSVFSNDKGLIEAYNDVAQKSRKNPFVIGYLDDLIKSELVNIKLHEKAEQKLGELLKNKVKKINNLNNNLDESNEEKASLIQKHQSEIKEANNNLKEVKVAYENSLEEFENEKETLLKMIESNNELIKTQEVKITTLETTLESKNKELEKLPVLEEKLELKEEQLTIKDESIVALKDNKKILEDNVTQKEIKLDELNNKNIKLDDELAKAKEQNSLKSKQILEYDKSLQTKTSQIENLQNEYKMLDSQLAEMTSKNELQEKTNKDLRKELEKIKELNEALELQNESLTDKLKIAKELRSEKQKTHELSKKSDQIKGGIDYVRLNTHYIDTPFEKDKAMELFDKIKNNADVEFTRVILSLGSFDSKQIESSENYEEIISELEKINEKGILNIEDGVYSLNNPKYKQFMYENHKSDISEIVNKLDVLTKYDKKHKEDNNSTDDSTGDSTGDMNKVRKFNRNR